jgi:peptidyl-prolyl cis-trans isomerase-like 2
MAKQAQTHITTSTSDRKDDDTNWFGVKVGNTLPTITAGTGSTVGKYLQMKRSQPEVSASEDESRKKRKVGFGDFEGW